MLMSNNPAYSKPAGIAGLGPALQTVNMFFYWHLKDKMDFEPCITKNTENNIIFKYSLFKNYNSQLIGNYSTESDVMNFN